jgi:chromosome segregation ATPase
MDGGFVDLRQATDNGSGSDSFWPSFTDIMMVVVMIFMIASTALMLRNWELVEELRATIIAEMQAEELARSMTETSATLEEQLAQAQHANSELRIQRMRSNERIAELEVRLAARDQRVMELETDNQQLAASLQKYRRDAMLDADQLKQTQDELATLQQRLDEVLVELSEGEEARQQQSVELATLRLGSSLTEQQLLNLQMEYSELQVKSYRSSTTSCSSRRVPPRASMSSRCATGRRVVHTSCTSRKMKRSITPRSVARNCTAGWAP